MKDKENKEADLTMLAHAALEAIRKDLYEDQKAKKKAAV